MDSQVIYTGELANAQQLQTFDCSVIAFFITGTIPVEVFNLEARWGDFANSKEVEAHELEELRFPDDQDVIEYINERTQEALNARKSGKKFSSLEALQKEFLET